MKRKLYIYDFDGTITKTDSLFHFLNYALTPVQKIRIVLLFTPIYILQKLSFIHPARSKERLMEMAFSRVKIEMFEARSQEFVTKKLNELVYPSFITHLNNLGNDHTQVVVSASFSSYLIPWSKQHQIDVLCTELEVKDGILTGKFATPNCNGEEKVKRIKEAYDLSLYDEVHVFGNSPGDLPMMELGTHRYYRYFK